MKQLLENNKLILMEAAIVERLRRSSGVQLHPDLVNAPLIYDPAGRAALTRIYREYIGIASQAGLPLLICTPTWRANRHRVLSAQISRTINADAARFMQEIRGPDDRPVCTVRIGGMLGCRNDCYQPGQGLSAQEAEQFHAWQVEQLAAAGVDFLIAETLPSVEEAIGIARAMEATGLPYIISFVISRDGRVLDGSSLQAAVTMIDSATRRRPLGFMVNCAYPSFLCADQQPPALFPRLIGYQANASSLDHCDLDGADSLEAESVSQWGDLMLELNRAHGLKILGGCCGTDSRHLQYLVDNR